MTLSDIQTLVRNLVYEPAGDAGLVDDTQLTAFVNAANQVVYQECVARRSGDWVFRSADVSVSPTTGFDLTTIDNSTHSGFADGYYAITYVELKAGDGRYYPLEPLETPQDRSIHEPVFIPVPVETRGFYYYIENDTLRMSPQPASAATCRVNYVAPLKLMSSGTDKALAGRLSMFHQLVAWEAACMVFAKDEKVGPAAREARNQMRTQLWRHLVSMSKQRGRAIRRTVY